MCGGCVVGCSGLGRACHSTNLFTQDVQRPGRERDRPGTHQTGTTATALSSLSFSLLSGLMSTHTASKTRKNRGSGYEVMRVMIAPAAAGQFSCAGIPAPDHRRQNWKCHIPRFRPMVGFRWCAVPKWALGRATDLGCAPTRAVPSLWAFLAQPAQIKINTASQTAPTPVQPPRCCRPKKIKREKKAMRNDVGAMAISAGSSQVGRDVRGASLHAVFKVLPLISDRQRGAAACFSAAWPVGSLLRWLPLHPD